MKYRLRYSRSTLNYHVYVVESKDPRKRGKSVYIPRFNDPEMPLVETDIIMHEGLEQKQNRVRAKVSAEPEPA